MKHVDKIPHRHAYTMRVADSFLADLDDLRAAERPVLTRAAMLRRLVDAEKERRKVHARKKHG
jgi:hypothetical protein